MVDNDKANDSISKTEKKADGLGKKFLDGVKTVGKWGAAVGGAAVAAGGAMLAMGVKVGNVADELLDLQAITGMSTSEIQRWRRVSSEAGVSATALTDASYKLTKSLDTMAREGGKGNEALEALGLSFEEITSMNADERMNAITQALAGVEDTTERAKIGTDLLGGSWKDIAPIVDMGTEAMQRAKDSANVLSEEDLNKANEFRMRWAELKDQFNFFFMELSLKVLPILQVLFDWIQKYMPQIQSFVEVAFDFISKAIEKGIEWIGNLITWLKDWYENNDETIQAIKDGFMDFADSVMNLINGFIVLFKRIWEKYGDDILKFISNAWDLIKSVFSGAFDLIKDIFNVFASLFKGDWSQLWEDVKTLASNLWNNIKDIINDAIDLIIDTFKSINLFEIGKNIIQGLINGIKNMAGAISDTVKDVASNITGGFKRMLGIKSPSTVMEHEVGEEVTEGAIVGMENKLPKLAVASKRLSQAMINGVQSNSSSAPSTVSTSQPVINITLDNAIITDDYGVDRLMDRIVERMQTKGGFAL